MGLRRGSRFFLGLVGLTREHCAGSALTMNLKLIVSIGSVIAGAFFIATESTSYFTIRSSFGALRGTGLSLLALHNTLVSHDTCGGVDRSWPIRSNLEEIASLVGVFLILNFTAAILGTISYHQEVVVVAGLHSIPVR